MRAVLIAATVLLSVSTEAVGAGGASQPPQTLWSIPGVWSKPQNFQSNVAVGGNLAVTGTFAAGAFNNTSTLGYQINGLTAFFQTTGASNQEGVFLGEGSGEYYRTHGVAGGFGMLAAGVKSLQFLQSPGVEAVALGQYSSRFLINAYGTTSVGQSSNGADNSAYVTSGGNDSMRDTVGNVQSSCWGAECQRDGVGNSNTSTGAFSLHGNSGSISVTGTPVAGDVLRINFATTNANVTGLPATVSYTVPAAPTNAIVATGIAAAIGAQLTVGFIMPNGANMITELGLPNFATAFPASVGNPGIVGLHWPGGNTTGWAITPTIGSCTGTCTEVLTVNAPFSGTDNLADGVKALYGIALTAANANDGRGTAALANLSGASSGVQCYGFSCGFNVLTGSNSFVAGLNGMFNATQLNSSVVIAPGLQGTANPVTNWVILGAANGNAGCFGTGLAGVSLGYGDCPLSSSVNNQLSIQSGAIAGLNNNKGGGGPGGGQIGVEIASASVMNATFTISDYSGAATYGSHFRVHQTTAPALSACGGSPGLDATASDTAGLATEGTTATGCVITFATAYATTPHCSVSNWAGNAQPVTLSACSTAALTVTNSSGSGNKFTYQVIQ